MAQRALALKRRERCPQLRSKLEHLKPSERAFCLHCNLLLAGKADINKHKQHPMRRDLDDDALTHPSSFLPALTGEKGNAQYLFAPSATQVLSDLLQEHRLLRVVCVGTPTVHEHLKEK